MDTVIKLGAWGCAGVLVGIALITWLGDHLDRAGAAFLVLLCVAVFVIIGGLVGFILSRKRGG
jgi:hypothetical protein